MLLAVDWTLNHRGLCMELCLIAACLAKLPEGCNNLSNANARSESG
jgi:hypothetical protein